MVITRKKNNHQKNLITAGFEPGGTKIQMLLLKERYNPLSL